MARKRMVSQDLLLDEAFNSLSLAAQNLFIRMLVVSDDYGVVPASEYVLEKLLNLPAEISLRKNLKEIVSHELGRLFTYQDKPYFIFKRDRFDEYQSFVVRKRTRSEYLRLTSKEIMELSKHSKRFLELPGNSTPTALLKEVR